MIGQMIMSRRRFIILIILVKGIVPLVSSIEFNSRNIIYVDDDGTADYTSIQDAIDNASDGDIIIVYEGVSPYAIIIS